MYLRESVSTVSLPNSYVCTDADEDRRTGAREGENAPTSSLLRPSSFHPFFLSFSFSPRTCSRSTTNRRRLVICFHTFAAFASLRLFLHLRARSPFFPLFSLFSDSFTFSPSTVAREHRPAGTSRAYYPCPAETGIFLRDVPEVPGP